MKTLPSIGSLLDRAFELYFKNVRVFLAISALYFLSSVPFILGTLLAPGKDIAFLVANGLVSPVEKIGLFLNGFTTIAVLLIVSLLVTICVILVSKQLLEKKVPETKPLILEGLTNFAPILLVKVVQFFVTMLPLVSILPGILMIWLAVNRGVGILSLFGVFLYFFGLILAIAGILYIGIHLQFGPFSALIKRTAPIEALKASRELVRGRFLATILRLAIPKFIIFVSFFLSQIVAFLLITILFFYLPVEATDAVSKTADIVAHLLRTAIIAIWFPLFTVTDTILFNDLEDSRS